MRITTPIYYVTIEGNLKEIVSELPDVIIATYEDYDNKTLVVVNASNEVILVPGIGCDVRHFSMRPDFVVLQLSSV